MGKKRHNTPPSFSTIGKNSHFTPMFDDQMDSPAFIALSAVAVRVYLILRKQFKGDYTGNNIVCPYERIIENGVSRNSIPGALRQLEALGFITCKRGGLAKQASVYSFSSDWKNIATKEDADAIVKEVRERIAEEKDFRKQAEDKASAYLS